MFQSAVDPDRALYTSLDPVVLLNKGPSSTLPDDKSSTTAPRPATLPGLAKKTKGYVSDDCILNPPKASLEVRNFANSLVEGVLSDTISRALSSNLTSDETCKNNNDDAANTDVSLSLDQEEEGNYADDEVVSIFFFVIF